MMFDPVQFKACLEEMQLDRAMQMSAHDGRARAATQAGGLTLMTHRHEREWIRLLDQLLAAVEASTKRSS